MLPAGYVCVISGLTRFTDIVCPINCRITFKTTVMIQEKLNGEILASEQENEEIENIEETENENLEEETEDEEELADYDEEETTDGNEEEN